MLAIQKYISEHGLEKTIKDFQLKTREYDSKILLKYDQLVSNELMGLPEMQDCRGIILEKDTWKVMSLAFRKFFNSEESNAHKINWQTARVLEKLDGTMIQLYWDWNKREWFAGTTGTAEGEGEVNNKLGTTFNDLFWETLESKNKISKILWSELVNKNFCFIFELTTPYNIVVKPHGESSVTLLAIRNIDDLNELIYDELTFIGESLGISIVKSYDLNARNVGSLLKTFEDMPWSDEGYVVVDRDFNRIKIKNPAYVAVHHLKGKSAEHNILTIIKSNEIEEFASTFPERREELYKLKESYDSLLAKLNIVWCELILHKPKNIEPSEKKRFAAAVFSISEKHNVKEFTALFFGLNDGKISSVEDYLLNYDDKRLYNML
jgi:hypothetical protein